MLYVSAEFETRLVWLISRQLVTGASVIPSGAGCNWEKRNTEEFPARILVVDDDRILRKALKRFFESEGFIVDAQSDGKGALEAFHAAVPAAIILDLGLPVISGQQVCHEIRQVSDTVPILVLSGAADVVDKIRLLELGADDYVTKPFSPRELLARLRAAIRHASKNKQSDVAFFGGVSIDFLRMTASLDGKSVQLTAGEFKLLKYFLQRAERVISREEILQDVFGYHDRAFSRSVDNCILRLRRKLERDPDNPVHFRTIRRVGYRFQLS